MQIDRTKRPSISGELRFQIPKVTVNKLSNGLVYYHSRKNNLPIVRINLIVNSGSIFDPENKKGLSNLLTSCIDEGAGEYNALQLEDEFDMLGAQFSVSSDLDSTLISMQVLSENFKPAIKLFKNVITEPHLYEDDFNREKRKALVKLIQLKIKPEYIADISFEHFLFGKDCPYSFPVAGFQKSVENIFNKDVRDFYQQKFSPLNSALIIVGDIDLKSLEETLLNEFGSWDNRAALNKPKLTLNNKKQKIYVLNKPDSVQTEIRIGQLTSKMSNSDFFQKQILNLILGGQFSSRLNINLREKQGYTYGINSSFNYFKEAGYFKVSTSVSTETTANALREIYSELIKIREGITSDELAFAKSSITKRFPSNFETYRQISLNIIIKLFYDLPDDYFDTYLQKVNVLTLDEVNEIASKSISRNELITVLAGNSEKILEQLDEKEFGEIAVNEFDDLFK